MPPLLFPPTISFANTVTGHAMQKTLAPALVAPPAKPWKQPKPVPRIYRQRSTPAGRTVGREWCSNDCVCGAAVGPEWDLDARCAYETDVQGEWERECARENQYGANGEDARGRIEVCILDIAKPAKRRGESLLFWV